MRTKIAALLKLAIAGAILLSLSGIPGVFAQQILPIPGDDIEVQVEGEESTTTSIYAEGNIPIPPDGESGQEIATKLVLAGLQYVKVITAVLGVLYIVLLGYMLLSEAENEESITRVKRGFIYSLISFMLISMSQDFGRIFDFSDGTLLQSPQEILRRVRLFDRQVEIVITFIKYIVSGYAILMVVRSASLLISGGGSEDKIAENRRSILYSIGGLLLVGVGDVFINRVFYKVDKDVYTGLTGVTPGIDAQAGIEQLAGITNLIVTFAGPLAVLMLVIGAVMYATSAGEEERMQKAKRLVFATVVGIVVIYGAFAFVSTIIAGQLESVGALSE